MFPIDRLVGAFVLVQRHSLQRDAGKGTAAAGVAQDQAQPAHLTGWLFRVARNRFTDLFRRRQPERLGAAVVVVDDGEMMRVADLLPSAEAGPDAELVRRRLVAEIERALNELPEEQRAVFIGHELEGRSFKRMAAETGVNVNTLLARKRYAVLHLRKRLQQAFDEMRDRRGG